MKNETILRAIGIAAFCLLAVTAALLLRPGSTDAHGVQVESDPAPNSQLQGSPEMITISFSEPIEPSVSTIQLWNQAGEEVPLGELEFFDDPTMMAIHLPEELPFAIYTVIWRNLSTIDGHTWSGSFPFTVLGPLGIAPTGGVAPSLQQLAQPPSDAPSTLETTARWVVLLGSAIMLGGAAYVLVVASPAARVLSAQSSKTLRALSRDVLVITSAIAAFLVLEGSLLQIVVQADRLGGLGRFDELLTDTRVGHYIIARQGLLLVALLATALVWRAGSSRAAVPAALMLLTASFGVLLTQSLVSHSAASDGAVLATTIDVLHLLAASLWVGGLIHIGLAMPRWLDELKGVPRTLFAAESFRRFSLLAAGSIVVLMVSGVLSALIQFTAWNQLWSTSYGWALVSKMAVMLPLLAVAGLNAFILEPRIAHASLQMAGGSIDNAGDSAGAGVSGAAERLQRLLATTVRLEAVLAIVVLIAVAVLIQLQSPRSNAEAADQAATLADQAPPPIQRNDIRKNAEVDGLIMSLIIEPGQLGENKFELGLGSEFGPIGEVLAGGVRLEFEHADAGEGGSRLALPLFGSAKFESLGSNLSLPGDWTITANVQRRGEDDVRATWTVTIDAPEDANAAAIAGSSDTLWQWPFQGGRSTGAIAVLAAGGIAAIVTGGWQLRRLRAGS